MGTAQFFKLPRVKQNAIAAARLKKRATPAENAFRCHLATLGLCYHEQRVFNHPTWRIVDFYLPGHNLVIEIDGPYHHAERDRLRDEAFTKERGIRVLRLTNEDVLSGRIPDLRLNSTRGV
jgi:very-short-patch-repair endonuclease